MSRPSNRLSKSVLVLSLPNDLSNAVRKIARARDWTVSQAGESLIRGGLKEYADAKAVRKL
jgi:hypothetical protein